MTNNKSLFARIPFSGVAIPLIVSTTYWYSNMNRLPYEDALPTIAIFIAIWIGVIAVLRLVAGSWVRAGLMTAIAAAYSLYLPQMIRIFAQSEWVRWTLLAVAAVIAIDLARRIPRERTALLALNRSMNAVFFTVALLVCAVAGAKQIYLENARPQTADIFPTFKGTATANSPDVWHFIFDRYAGGDSLQRVYHFDNRPFLDALKARGFAVQEHAFSNYQRTGHSVSSTLNGAYLDGLAANMANHQTDWVPLYRAMAGNAALRFFAAHGYATFFAGSWWNPTRRSLLAGSNVNFYDMPELGRLILDQSVVGMLLENTDLPYADGRNDQCRREHLKFEELTKIAAEKKQKYIFAHFLLPHPPFVINADGTCRSLAQATHSSRRNNYVGQVEYANSQILKLIDKIEAGPRPAIIIIHADEGPWPLPFVGDERFPGTDPVAVDWPRINQSQLHEKMGVLLAVKSPDGKSTRDLPVSAVNLYPIVLHNHFGGAASGLPDRHYLFVSDKALYTFDDVTERLREPPL